MIARIRRFALAALTAIAAGIAASRLGAQQPSAPPSGNGPTAHQAAPPAGPTVDRAAVGVRPLPQQPATLDEAEAALQSRLGLGRARALMIVGFGALIVGLLIGDDVGALVAVAGAAVGLYGLYHYLK
jgi:hypothetical protein